MNTIDQLKWRYATKKFDASKVLSEEKINILTQAFNLTATSYGLQSLKLVIVTNKAIRKELVRHSYNQQQVLNASHLLVICIEDDILDSNIDTHFDTVKDVRSTPETILAPYRHDLKSMMASKSIEERLEWSTKQAYIALGNLMTVCAIEDIDSCPMEGFNPLEYDTLLELKSKGLKSVLLLPVGYRAEDDMFATLKKVRKHVSETVIEI